MLLWWFVLLFTCCNEVSSLPRRGQSAVEISLRRKPERSACPVDNYNLNCQCRSRKLGLDITCREITMSQLRHDCVKLKAEERTIRYFKISDSFLPRLEDYVFLGLKIEHLLIHNCSLQSVSHSALSSQGGTLRHLVLSGNKFEDVPTAAIKELRELEHLNLNGNQIKVVRNQAFNGLSKVTRLSLYNNKIHKIETDAFAGMTRDLIRLNLVKNELHRVPHSAIVTLKNLDRLDLSENKISEINPDEFLGLDKLDTLILNDNQLIALGENNFEGLNRLTTLYIDRNQIATIHENAFIGLEENLQSLTLTGNRLVDFPSSSLRKLHQLTTLHIDDNSITTIYENSFQGFGEHIRHLWFQNNHIQNIPAPAFQYLHSLEWIKLYNNELKTLSYELMEPVLDTLMHIDIHSNPLICDCNLRWYKQWISEEWNEIDEDWLKDTHCRDPSDKDQEHNIAEVSITHMYCDESVTNKPSTRIKDDGGGVAKFYASVPLFMIMNIVVFL